MASGRKARRQKTDPGEYPGDSDYAGRDFTLSPASIKKCKYYAPDNSVDPDEPNQVFIGRDLSRNHVEPDCHQKEGHGERHEFDDFGKWYRALGEIDAHADYGDQRGDDEQNPNE